MRASTFAGLLAVAFALTPTPADAKDLTLRQRVTITGPRTGTHESTQYWTANHVVTDAPSTRIIVNLSAETVTMADKQRRTFYTQTFAELQKQSEALRPKIANLPPQARALMEKMGGDPKAMDAPVSLKPTGKSEKIAGYEAKEYILEGGMMRGSVWVSEARASPAGAKAGAAFANMMGPAARMATAFAQLKGTPLRTVMGAGAGQQGFRTTTEVIEVSQAAPPAEVLKVPEGFTKVDPPKFQAPSPKATLQTTPKAPPKP